MGFIFISHSSRDDRLASDLDVWLTAEGHTSVFLDHDDIAGGTEWEEQLYTELRRCRALLALVSVDWLRSPWCIAEANHAQALRKKIIPLRIGRVDPELYARTAPPVLRRVQSIDSWPDNGAALRLRQALAQAGLDSRNLFEWKGNRDPYPGLAAFDQDDAPVYFGREQEITDLLAIMETCRAPDRERCVVVQGASGAGKSSLVRAGVLPRLARDIGRWLVLPPFRPRRAPLRELADAMAATTTRMGRELPQPVLMPVPDENHLAEMCHWIVAAADSLRRAEGRLDATVLITVDQLEETLDGSAAGHAFLSALRDSLASADHRLLVLATLRADFVATFQRHAFVKEPTTAGEILRTRVVQLGTMPRSSFYAVIEGPAALAGLLLEQGLASRLVDDAGTDDALPLLAFVMRELWMSEGQRDLRLTHAHYDRYGGIRNAVGRRAAGVFAELRPSDAEVAAFRSVLLFGMADYSFDGQLIRERLPFADIPATSKRIIDAFTASRLLVTDDTGVEVAHEALYRNWATLANWVEMAMDDLRSRRRVVEAFHAWNAERIDRSSRLLPPGRPLEEARELLGKPHVLGSSELAAFIEESIAFHDRRVTRARKRQRSLLAGAVVAAIVFLIVSVIATKARRYAVDRARAANEAAYRGRQGLGRLAMLLANQPGSTHEAVARGMEAYFVEPGSDGRVPPEAMEGLSMSVAQLSDVLPLRGAGVGRGIAFSRDGIRAVTASADGMARLWDLRTGQTVRLVGEHIPKGVGGERLTSVWLSPDEQFIGATSMMGTVQFWNVATGARSAWFGGKQGLLYDFAFSPVDDRVVLGGYELNVGSPPRAYIGYRRGSTEPVALIGHTGRITDVDYSIDGKKVLTVSSDGTGRVWDADSAQTLAVLRGHTSAVTSGMFSPDGRFILTASSDGSVRMWSATQRGEVVATKVYRLRLSTSGRDGELSLAASYSRDGRRFLLLSSEGDCQVWQTDIEDMPTVLVARPASGKFTDAAFSPDGLLVGTINEDGGVRIWSAITGDLVHQFRHVESEAETLVFSPIADEVRVLVGRFGGPAELLTMHGGTSVMVLRGSASTVEAAQRANPNRHFNVDVTSVLAIQAASFSPDGHSLATVGNDGSIVLWNTSTGRAVRSAVVRGRPGTAAFSPDGHHIGIPLHEDGVALWDLHTGVLRAHTLDPQTIYRSIDFSPDGKMMALGGVKLIPNPELEKPSDVPMVMAGLVTSGAVAEIRYTSTAALVKTLVTSFSSEVRSVDFNADGTSIVGAVEDGTIVVWDAASGKVRRSIKGHAGGAWSARYSFDGKEIVSSGADDVAILWNTKLEKRLRLTSHRDEVISAAVSPGNDRVVTASWDGTVRVWNAAGGSLTAIFRMHAGQSVWNASFSSDGGRLLSVGGDGAARVYPAKIESLFDIAARMLRFQPEHQNVKRFSRSSAASDTDQR